MGCAANSTFCLTENCEQKGGKVQVFYSLEVFGSYMQTGIPKGLEKKSEFPERRKGLRFWNSGGMEGRAF